MKRLIEDNEFALEVLNRISNMPLKKDSHFFAKFGNIKIIDAVNRWEGNQIPAENYPAIIFLRVVLAANRKYNTHVEPHINRIIKEYPNLKSIQSLKNIVTSKSRDEFYKFWGHKNLKKYNTLLNLIEATDQIRLKYKISDDYNLMNKWAEDVDIFNYESDLIGRIKNIAIATIQHLRMDFGINTVKPDQRVLEVLKREFEFKKVNQIKAIQLVKELAGISNIKVRELDLILVNYGSGYYDNRKYSSQVKLRTQIADKLNDLGVNQNIIYEATGIKLKVSNNR